MRRFDKKEQLIEWIETMHLQNTNGRETGEEMFRLGIEATLEELTDFNLISMPIVVRRNEQLKCGNKNPPCAPNSKFGILECCECNWSE